MFYQRGELKAAINYSNRNWGGRKAGGRNENESHTLNKKRQSIGKLRQSNDFDATHTPIVTPPDFLFAINGWKTTG